MGYCLLGLSFPICIPARTITNQLCEEDEYSKEKVLRSAFPKVCYRSMLCFIGAVRIFFRRTYQNLDYRDGHCESPGEQNRKPFPNLFKSDFFSLEHLT